MPIKMLIMRIWIVVILPIFIGCVKEQDSRDLGPPYSPADALSTFEIEDGFRIELFAAEPLTTDPIAMEIDEDGRIYVVEMTSYPMDTSGVSRVRLLEDTNGDGYPDQSVVFAEGLKFPTGIMRWRAGVLVTDPPNLVYMEDSTGDGVADIRRTVLEGFALSNPQHNVNTPLYGLDNWIYLANSGTVTTHLFQDEFGDQGDEVYFPDRPDGPRLGQNADGRNVRLKPDSFELESLSSSSQFGQTFDVWGRHFQVSNARRMFHEVVAARYLQRNPDLLISNARHFIPDDDARVFPITEDPEHQWLTEVGVFTSACGVTCYLGGEFPGEYHNMMLMAEPQHNLVRIDEIIDSGSTFTARNLLDQREFLASRDSWFRPVNFYVGPDGAVYLIDYYRQIIDHPEWLSQDVVESGDLYRGSDMGRIYRIVPSEAEPPTWSSDLNLSAATDEELVRSMESENIWWRRTTQRLLVDRGSESSVSMLLGLADDSPLPEARLHALWTLEGMGELTAEVIEQALSDSEPGIRENAIKLAELHLSTFPALENALLRMIDDPNSKVRFQLLLTLGELDSDEAGEARQTLLFRDFEDEWSQIAALSSSATRDPRLFEDAVEELADQESDGRRLYFRRVGSMIGARGHIQEIRNVIRTCMSSTSDRSEWWRASALEGLAEGIRGADLQVRQLSAEMNSVLAGLFDAGKESRGAYIDLLSVVGIPSGSTGRIALQRAVEIAAGSQHDPELRADAFRLISLGDPSEHMEMLAASIDPQEAPEVQLAAVNTLGRTEGDEVPGILLDRWQRMTPEVRSAAGNVLMRDSAGIHRLLDGVEQGVVPPSTIEWWSSVRLMRHRDQEVRVRALALLGEQPGEREEIVDRYRAEVPSSGDWERGERVFAATCAPCHQMDGADGVDFGPDMNTVRHWSRDALIRKILDPSRAVADGFDMWVVERTSGSTAVGVLVSQMPASITLRNVEHEVTIPRSDIQSMTASNTSPMPSGLENQISKEEMADLLEFMRRERPE